MEYFAYQWHITDYCDQRCKHCYIFSENQDKKLLEMPFEKVKETLFSIEEMCQKENKIPYIYLTGGDPILHTQFWDILKLFKEHHIAFGILGNPFHLNDEVCLKLREYGCLKYQLSLDGLKETHDYFRKPGSFDITLEKIKCLKKAGIKVAIMTTVSGTNIKEIPDIIDLVVKNNVDIFAFGRYCPTSLEKSTHIEPLEYRNLLDICWQKFEQYKENHTSFNLKDHLWTLYLYEKGAQVKGASWWGKISTAIFDIVAIILVGIHIPDPPISTIMIIVCIILMGLSLVLYAKQLLQMYWECKNEQKTN